MPASVNLSKALASGNLALYNRSSSEIMLYFPNGKTPGKVVLPPGRTTVLTDFAPIAAWRKSSNLQTVAACGDVRVVPVPKKELSKPEVELRIAEEARLAAEKMSLEAARAKVEPPQEDTMQVTTEEPEPNPEKDHEREEDPTHPIK